jgi:hypothetical protein
LAAERRCEIQQVARLGVCHFHPLTVFGAVALGVVAIQRRPERFLGMNGMRERLKDDCPMSGTGVGPQVIRAQGGKRQGVCRRIGKLESS